MALILASKIADRLMQSPKTLFPLAGTS